MAKKKMEALDAGNELMASLLGAKKLSEEKEKYVVKNWFSTGNMMLNTIISGHPLRGVPDNKFTMFAGKPGSTKSYISKMVMRDAQKKGYTICVLDSEGDLDPNEFAEEFGLDLDKIIIPDIPTTVEGVRHYLTTLAENEAVTEDTKLMICIDSIGNYPSSKEVNDARDGNDKTDMTRAKIWKSLFRIIATQFRNKRIPIIGITHVYDSMSMFGGTVISGGSGANYNASITIMLSTSKIKDDNKDVKGLLVRCKAQKNRLVKNEVNAEFILDYEDGILLSSGLLTELLNSKIATKASAGSKGSVLIFKDEPENKIPIKGLTDEWWLEVLNNKGLLEYIINKYAFGKNKQLLLEQENEKTKESKTKKKEKK